jgi:hypothetical protein
MHTRRAVLSLLALAACSKDATGPRFNLSAAIIDVPVGDAQVATVAQMLPVALTARLRDSATLKPEPGILINWVVVQGGGAPFAGSAITNDSGLARERWTLGTQAGPQVMEARAVDPVTGEPIVYARVTATALPGPIVTLRFAVLRERVFGDSAIALPIVAQDAYGNAVPAPAPQALDGLAPVKGIVQAVLPGQFRYVLGTDTFRLFVHVPGGAWRSVEIRGDTTLTQTGTLVFAGYTGYFGDTTATYEIDNYLSTRAVLGTITDSLRYGVYRYVAHRAAQSIDGYQGELDFDYALAPSGVRVATWGEFQKPWAFARTDGVADSVTISR